MGKSHEDYQSEVRVLFLKLTSWMDEAHSQFSTIIDKSNRSVTKGVDDLVKEVTNLQDELSVIKKEKNILIETVNCLNGEIRRQNEITAKKNQSNQIDCLEVKTPDEVGRDTDKLESVHDTGKELETNGDLVDEEVAEKIVNHNYKSHKNYHNNLNDSSNNESGCIKEEMMNVTGGSVVSEESACPECNFVFSNKENLRIHVQNVHPKLEQTEVLERGDSNTDPSHISKSNATDVFSRDMRLIQNKMRKNICEECDVVFSSNQNLKRHKAAVHDMVRKFKCKMCQFKTNDKRHFENHQANIHKIDIGRNKLKCSNCSYETFCNGTLNRHKAAVHNIGKKYECEQCLYKTATKRSLNFHQANKHNIDIGREKLKCDKCTYKTLFGNDMKRHITIKHSGTRKRT